MERFRLLSEGNVESSNSSSLPSKSITFNPFSVLVCVVGWDALVACVTWFPLPLLSDHWLTAPELAVIVPLSAASYQPEFPWECNYAGIASLKAAMILRWIGLVSVYSCP